MMNTFNPEPDDIAPLFAVDRQGSELPAYIWLDTRSARFGAGHAFTIIADLPLATGNAITDIHDAQHSLEFYDKFLIRWPVRNDIDAIEISELLDIAEAFFNDIVRHTKVIHERPGAGHAKRFTVDMKVEAEISVDIISDIIASQTADAQSVVVRDFSEFMDGYALVPDDDDDIPQFIRQIERIIKQNGLVPCRPVHNALVELWRTIDPGNLPDHVIEFVGGDEHG